MIINNPKNPTTKILPSNINMIIIKLDILEERFKRISYKDSTAEFN